MRLINTLSIAAIAVAASNSESGLASREEGVVEIQHYRPPTPNVVTVTTTVYDSKPTKDPKDPKDPKDLHNKDRDPSCKALNEGEQAEEDHKYKVSILKRAIEELEMRDPAPVIARALRQ
ncbi:Hypothetical protein YALIH222_S04E25708G [Yarrowia lipolytica]|nr:Hypothetical protein YALIH222_S04E25708G [Yarrowia lipolytica]